MNLNRKTTLVLLLLLVLVILGGLFFYFNRLEKGPCRLTEKEIQWLRDRGNVVTTTGDPRYYPIDFYEGGEHGGYCSDLLQLLEKKIGVKFKYSPAKTWSDALKMAEQGEVDMITSVAPTKDRRKSLHFTQVYLNIPNYIITHVDNQDIFMDSDLEGKNVAITKHYGSQYYYEDHYPEINIISKANDEVALQDVSLKNVDAVVSDLIGTSYYVDRNKVSNIKVVAQAEYSWRLAFGVSRKDPVLTSILNKGLNLVSPEEWSELKDNWISYKFEDYSLHKTIIIVLAILVSLILFSLGLIFLWNRKLKQEVEVRTKELQELKEDLEEKVISKTKILDTTILKLKEANKESNRLFSIVSHDLKNSFHGLIGISAMLKNSKNMKSEELNTYLDAISNTSEKMHKLLLNLLEWTSTKSENIKEEEVLVEIEKVISDVISQFEVNLLVKNIKLVRQIENGEIKIAESKVSTILRNLIDNAIKFSEINSEIIIKSSFTEKDLELKITDFGTGCNDLLENLFSTKKPSKQIGTLGEKGTGLGLLLCRQCLDDLGGTMSMSSEENKGSTFTVNIPLKTK